MKQVAQTEQIKSQLRAAFGADANLDTLVVYEAILLNTLPLRKGGGIFKGARNTPTLLGQMAAWVNRESVPLQLAHDTSELPYGRVFHAEVSGDELRGLFAVDGQSHPDLVTKLDSGVLDQVSVGFTMKSLRCAKCDFNFKAPNALSQLFMLECDDGHRIGEDGNFVWVDDLEYFFELSLVGMGAANGAKIVGRSDARIANDNQLQQRLAASTSDFVGVRLSPTLKDPSDMNAEQMATFQAAVAGEATAKAELATARGELETVRAALATAEARVAELSANTDLAAATEAKEAAEAQLQAAVEALQAELKVVLTASGAEIPAELPADVATLTAQIAEKRAAFAGVIPVGGASQQTAQTAQTPAVTPAASAAFRAAR